MLTSCGLSANSICVFQVATAASDIEQKKQRGLDGGELFTQLKTFVPYIYAASM